MISQAGAPHAAARLKLALETPITRSRAQERADTPSRSCFRSRPTGVRILTPRASRAKAISPVQSPYCRFTKVTPGLPSTGAQASKGAKALFRDPDIRPLFQRRPTRRPGASVASQSRQARTCPGSASRNRSRSGKAETDGRRSGRRSAMGAQAPVRPPSSEAVDRRRTLRPPVSWVAWDVTGTPGNERWNRLTRRGSTARARLAGAWGPSRSSGMRPANMTSSPRPCSPTSSRSEPLRASPGRHRRPGMSKSADPGKPGSFRMA